MELVEVLDVNSIKKSTLKMVEILLTAVAIILMYVIFKDKLVEFIVKVTEKQILIIGAFSFLTLAMHEFIHIIFLVVFGKGDAIIRLKFINGTIYVHQVNEDVFYTKKDTILLLLAPLVIIDLVAFLIMAVLTQYTIIIAFIVVLNTFGSFFDLFLVYKLFHYNNDIVVNYDTYDVSMNVFEEKSGYDNFFRFLE